MSKPLAVGYVRLSDASERSSSIPSQKKRVEEYCERYGLDLLEIFVDDGKSGWTFDRPGFIQLESFCKKNTSVKYLIIPHFDRFSRADPIDAMVKERQFRDKLKVKVLQVSEPPDTDTDSSTYQIIRFMQAFAANEERNRIVERVKNSIRFRLLQGRYCALAPFGYKNKRDEKGQGIMVVDPDRAPIIQYIFKQYLAGSGIEELRRLALEKGYTVKGKVAIQSVLANPVYAGLIRVPAYRDQPEKLVKAVHEPIVTESTYWHVQELLNPRRFTPQKRDEVPLRGVLRCRCCGKMMTAAPSKSRGGRYYWYYFCNVDRKENYSAIKTHQQLSEILNAISIKGGYLKSMKEKLSERIQAKINTQTKDLMNVNLLIRKVQESIEKIEEKYLQESVSLQAYRNVMNERKIRLADLQAEKEVINKGAIDYLGRLDAVLERASNVRTFYDQLNLLSKQRIIKIIFGGNLQLTPSGFRTAFVHSFFKINGNTFKELPLTIEKPEGKDEGGSSLVTPHGELPNSWEPIHSFFEIFAA